LKIEASFITSAASPGDVPRDGLAGIALVGRSNVGKSSLINALVRRRIARTSGAPGKTRLANIYRVVRGQAAAIQVIDLPGYGFARGGTAGFAELAAAVLARDAAALLLVDARHPGLESDRDAWAWLQRTVSRAAVVATKIDKLARGERIRAMGQLESVFDEPVLPVSAVTGEGLDELWKLIDSLVNRPRPNSSSPSSLSSPNSRSRPNSLSRPRRQPPSRPAAVAAGTALEEKRGPTRAREAPRRPKR
jgi:GTP-binding protein